MVDKDALMEGPESKVETDIDVVDTVDTMRGGITHIAQVSACS